MQEYDKTKNDPRTVELAKNILESYNPQNVDDLKIFLVPTLTNASRRNSTSLGYCIYSK